MKTWLRLTLIAMTVGGGFTGIVVTLQSFLASFGQGFLNSVLQFVAVAVYSFIFASGLIFVHNPHRTAPISVALAIQVPWISSPFLTYKLGAGSQLALSVGNIEPGRVGFHLGSDSFLGCTYAFNMLQENRWILGVNVIALVILLSLLKTTRNSIPGVQTTNETLTEPDVTAIPAND